LNENLKQLAKAKDDFLSNMSHELRTPLNAIVGFLDVLNKSKLLKEQKEIVSIIKSSSEILVTLINDILDFSKIESGKLTIEKCKFDISETLNNVYKLLKQKAVDKSLEFKIDIDDRIPKHLIGDKIRLNQIIINLVGNAVKFTNTGTVCIKADFVSKDNESVNILFSVKDTGIGIDEKNLEKIFERFEQASDDITRRFGGTGLGLSISKSLVELQGGKLFVRSKLGKGSEFYFTLNFKISKDSEYIFEKHDEYKDLGKLNILVFEDTPFNVKLIKKIFENTECHVDIADNGRSGIQLLEQNKDYDVILMDIQMPEMNGYEAANYITKTMNLNIPIIAMTADNKESERKKCEKLGMLNFITKPFKPDELFSVILKVVNCAEGNSRTEVSSTEKKFERIVKKRRSSVYKLYFANLFSFQDKMRNKNTFRSCIKEKYESVNKDVLKYYSGDDFELEKDLIEAFIKDFPNYLHLLEEHIMNTNFLEIQKLAHKMKSGVSYFGLNQVRHGLTEMEDFSKMSDINLIKSYFDIIKYHLNQNISELRSLLIKCY
jgi:CheY-like chemotaxis protein